MSSSVQVVIEEGKRFVFATAIDHPGWSRRGSDRSEALDALLGHGPRYAKAVRSARKVLVPTTTAGFDVVEIHKGDSSTDYGVPAKMLPGDAAPLNARSMNTWIAVLQACWKTFGTTARSHAKTQLRTGPRGGGRDIERMWEHVVEAQHAYLQQLGSKFDGTATGREPLWENLQAAFVQALHDKAQGKLPSVGPRGGIRWSVRYAIRRSAWHALDHAWEIEDRSA